MFPAISIVFFSGFIFLSFSCVEKIEYDVNALYELVLSVREHVGRANYDEAIRLSQDYLKRSRATTDSLRLNYHAHLTATLAYAHHEKGNYKATYKVYRNSKNLFYYFPKKDQIRMARWAGTAAAKLGDIREAERLYIIAIRLAHQHNDKEELDVTIGCLTSLDKQPKDQITLLIAILAVSTLLLAALLFWLFSRRVSRLFPKDDGNPPQAFQQFRQGDPRFY